MRAGCSAPKYPSLIFSKIHFGFRQFSHFRDGLERHGTLDAERCSLSVAVNLSDVRSVCRESARSDDRSVCRRLSHGSRDVRDLSLSTRAHGTIRI